MSMGWGSGVGSAVEGVPEQKIMSNVSLSHVHKMSIKQEISKYAAKTGIDIQKQGGGGEVQLQFKMFDLGV